MEKEKTTKTKKRAVKAEKPTKSGLTIDVLDQSGKVVESIELPKEVFGVKPNKSLIAQAIRVYLANQRLGNASTKSRGEVRGGGRKPWRQKGTGRARIGSIRAPHWRGGGVVFGPKPKDFSLELPKKMKQKALLSALAVRFNDKDMLVLKNLDLKEAKTKEASSILKNLNINGRTLVIDSELKDKEKRAFRNIEGTALAMVSNLNTYQVLDNKKLVFTKDAIKKLEEVFVNRGKND